MRADPTPLRELVTLTTRLAAEDCLSVLPPHSAHPEHVAHLTSLHVIAAETRLRDLLTAPAQAGWRAPGLTHVAHRHRLDPSQARAAAAVASVDPLVAVEGAAGAGKTTMLAAAIEAAAAHGHPSRVVTPTKKAADVAHQELGVQQTVSRSWSMSTGGDGIATAYGPASPLATSTPIRMPRTPAPRHPLGSFTASGSWSMKRACSTRTRRSRS